MSLSVATIDVRRVTGTIGAEITGVRVGPDLPGPVVKHIRDAILEHKVVFFREQHHLDDAGQAGFAQLLGELTSGRRSRAGAGPESYVRKVDSRRARAEAWHTDVTYTLRPAAMTMLRSVTLPAYGGDTAWANTAAAYQSMGPQLRELADGLWAVHSNDHVVGQRHAARASGILDAGRQAPEAPRKILYETQHPVVHVHPETGERALLLGVFAKRILDRPDSQRLIDLFQQSVTRLENTIRWRWAPGDMAIWDNRATQHCAIQDYGNLQRTMHRLTTIGDVPVSVDGRHSIALSDGTTQASA